MSVINKAIDFCYTGKMSVFEMEKKRYGSVSKLEKTLVYDNIPCLLTSMVSNRSVARDIKSTAFLNASSTVKKVFLSNIYNIKMGSYVEISQNGRIYTFEYSGESFAYSTHQEVVLESAFVA